MYGRSGGGVSYALSQLRTASSKNIIEVVNFWVYPTDIESQHWNSLDDCLVGNGFASLRTVKVTVAPETGQPDAEGHVWFDKLPKLHARGILEIDTAWWREGS